VERAMSAITIIGSISFETITSHHMLHTVWNHFFLNTCLNMTEHMPFSSTRVKQHRLHTNLYCLYRSLWWENDKQGIVAFSFTRSEPIWLSPVGHVKE